MKEELRELKRIVKIPRLHFKYLEKLEYEDMKGQLKEIEGKEQ